MPSIEALAHQDVREALRLLGHGDPPASRGAALKLLRETLTDHGAVRAAIDRAPEETRRLFVRLAHDGPATVEDLLGRGWWGEGLLPTPLDWLQRRALVMAGEDGLVHAVDEPRGAFLELVLDLPAPVSGRTEGVRVEGVRSVVVAPDSALLNRAAAVAGAGLRAVAATVAVSDRLPDAVTAALRAAGVPLAADAAVEARTSEPALPGSVEEAVGPRAIRALLGRAVGEGRQVRLQYFASSRGGAATDRVVDPWVFTDDLLRGHCHLRGGERTFALDRIGRAALLPTPLEHRGPA